MRRSTSSDSTPVRVLEPRIERVRRDLAREFACDPEEMAITQNASEANEIMFSDPT